MPKRNGAEQAILDALADWMEKPLEERHRLLRSQRERIGQASFDDVDSSWVETFALYDLANAIWRRKPDGLRKRTSLPFGPQRRGRVPNFESALKDLVREGVVEDQVYTPHYAEPSKIDAHYYRLKNQPWEVLAGLGQVASTPYEALGTPTEGAADA